MKEYNIVWFDDEFNSSLEAIKLQFSEHHIRCHGFESAEEGIQYLRINYKTIDAAIVDGNFFRKSGDRQIDDSGKALNDVVDVLKEIKSKKDIPYFVLSGAKNFKAGGNPLIHLLDLKVYDKVNEEETAQLCRDIISYSDATPTGHLKARYDNVFALCHEDYLGNRIENKLLKLAADLENPVFSGSAEDFLPPIRKVIEMLFYRLADYNLIPDAVLKEGGWITKCSRFLANNHNNYDVKLEIHPTVTELLRRLLDIVQDSAHMNGNLSLKIDDYCNRFNANYIYKSSIYQLFEILVYFRSYIDEHPDKDKNVDMWMKKEVETIANDDRVKDTFISGTVINYNAARGFAFCKPDLGGTNIHISPALVSLHSLNNDDQILVSFDEYPDKGTGEIKRTATSIKILESLV